MDRTTIKRKQAATINKALWPSLNYLFRLQTRMVKVGFPPADPLYLLVSAAYDAVQRLHVETHYLSCKGVGRPSADGEEDDEENGLPPMPEQSLFDVSERKPSP